MAVFGIPYIPFARFGIGTFSGLNPITTGVTWRP
jgi:hypothetical protein